MYRVRLSTFRNNRAFINRLFLFTLSRVSCPITVSARTTIENEFKMEVKGKIIPDAFRKTNMFNTALNTGREICIYQKNSENISFTF